MNASSIRDEWYCDEIITQNEWRNVCCVVAIRLVLKWRGDSLEYYCYLRNVEDLLADGKTPCARRIGEPTILMVEVGPVIPSGAMVKYHPVSSRDQPRLHPFGKKVLLGIFLGHVLIVGNLERTHYDCGHWGDGKPGLVKNPSSKRRDNATKGRKNFYIPNRRWNR